MAVNEEYVFRMLMENHKRINGISGLPHDYLDSSVSNSSLPDYSSCDSDTTFKGKKIIPARPNSDIQNYAKFLEASTSSMYKAPNVEELPEILRQTDNEPPIAPNVEERPEILRQTDNEPPIAPNVEELPQILRQTHNEPPIVNIHRIAKPKTKSVMRYIRTCSMCKKQNSELCYQFCSSCFNLRLQEYDVPGPKPKSIKSIIKKFVILKEDDNNDKETSASSSKDIKKSIKQLCNICLVRPQNGLFNHGKTGHVYCCYKCASKIWIKKGKCPICNQKIKGVTKIFIT